MASPITTLACPAHLLGRLPEVMAANGFDCSIPNTTETAVEIECVYSDMPFTLFVFPEDSSSRRESSVFHGPEIGILCWQKETVSQLISRLHAILVASGAAYAGGDEQTLGVLDDSTLEELDEAVLAGLANEMTDIEQIKFPLRSFAFPALFRSNKGETLQIAKGTGVSVTGSKTVFYIFRGSLQQRPTSLWKMPISGLVVSFCDRLAVRLIE